MQDAFTHLVQARDHAMTPPARAPGYHRTRSQARCRPVPRAEDDSRDVSKPSAQGALHRRALDRAGGTGLRPDAAGSGARTGATRGATGADAETRRVAAAA